VSDTNTERTETNMMFTNRTTPTSGARADADRKTAFTVGVLFIITIVASIPALLLYDPVLNDAQYVLGAGDDMRIRVGGFLEIVTAIANIGTAVALFSVLKRQHEGFALSYVASRVLESTIIVVGIVSVLSVVTLQQDGAGAADAGSLVIAGKSLVALHDWTFLLGPGFCAPIGNGLILGYLMYRSGLVPRRMAQLGLVGGTVGFASATATLLGVYDQVSVWAFIAIIPEFAWEASLGIWLTVKGFSASARVLAAPTIAPRGLAAD
jgi:hypothetical protein